MPADEKPAVERRVARLLLILLSAGAIVPPVLLVVAICNWNDTTAHAFITGMVLAAALGVVVALAALNNRLTKQEQFPTAVIKLALWSALSPFWLYLIFVFVLLTHAKF